MRITDTKGREYILCAIETDEGEQRYRPIVAGNANPLTGEKFEPSAETVNALVRLTEPLRTGCTREDRARAILLALGSPE